MNFYGLSALINFATCLLLGLFGFFKGKGDKITRSFLWFCLSISFWSISYFIWQLAEDEKTALLWSRILMAGAIFIPIFYLHFVVNLLYLFRQNKKIIISGYLIFLFFLLADFTPFFIKEVAPELSFRFWPKPGLLFHPFIIIWFAYVIYATYLLSKELSSPSEFRRVQIKYLLCGIILGYLGGSTNYFLFYDIPIPPIGTICVTFFVIFTLYAMYYIDIQEWRGRRRAKRGTR